VSELPLGDKKVGERAHETVGTVQDKIDVDQIQDQVAKLRDQIEHVLGSWKESFRPATHDDAAATASKDVADTAKKTTATKTAAAKKTAATKATTAKKKTTATKTAAAKKTTTK